jgi:hypothetical protein
VVGSEYILFLDADVVLTDPAFLEKAVNELEERGLDIASCDIQPVSGTRIDELSHRVYSKYARFWGARFAHTPGACLFVKTTMHKRIQGFDESVVFCEDHDYAKRAVRSGAKLGFLTSVTVSTSLRRFENDGRLNVALKYVLAELHTMTVGPIRHDLFNYSLEKRKHRSRLAKLRDRLRSYDT